MTVRDLIGELMRHDMGEHVVILIDAGGKCSDCTHTPNFCPGCGSQIERREEHEDFEVHRNNLFGTIELGKPK